MKKYIISFGIFCTAFLAGIVFINYKAYPKGSVIEKSVISEWNGRIENEKGTYNGTIIDDLFNGEGEFDFLTGEHYSGSWNDSYMSGEGVLKFPDIGEYSGEMSDSMRNGIGTFRWDTGESYEGSWENDKMSGEGKYTFSTDCIFEGIFNDNKPVSGELTYSPDTRWLRNNDDITFMKYVFSDSESTVQFRTKGGLQFNGDISALKESGKAAVTYPSGNKYEGEMTNGKRDGTGKYTWIDIHGKTTSVYDGSWSKNKMNGEGKYYYSDSSYPYFEGSFKNDIPEGKAIYYKSQTNTYEFTWKNGKATGIKET